jgi:addiction module HigA family antidote
MIPSRRHPTHPGEILQEEFLKPLGLTPKLFAQKLGSSWTELEITAIINGKEGISEKAANAFALAFGTTPAFWTRLEQQYCEWNKMHHHEKETHKPLKKAQ